jgi:hypothetical protein
VTVTPAVLLLAVLAIIAAQVAAAAWLRATLRESGGAPGEGGRRPAGEPPVGRRNDDFRSYQAVASEVAKRQVAVLAEVAEEVQRFERACFEHGRRICELLIGEWRRAGALGVPEAVPNDLHAAIQFFVLGSERPLDEAAQHRVRKDLEANVTVLQSYREATTSLLEANLFWLGLGLERELRRYVTEMGDIVTGASGHPKDLRTAAERFRALMEQHPDAAHAIEMLSDTGSRGPGAARIG